MSIFADKIENIMNYCNNCKHCKKVWYGPATLYLCKELYTKRNTVSGDVIYAKCSDVRETTGDDCNEYIEKEKPDYVFIAMLTIIIAALLILIIF